MWGWGWPCFDKNVLCFLMEIMYKNNMIYIRKQISVCIWKTRSTPTLFPFITVKWIIPNVYMKDQKKKNGGKMPPLCWQLDTTKIYITKSLITMNNILCPTNSKTYVKEPQNDGSLLVLWTHAITQWCNAIPTPQHKSKPTMVSVTPKNTWFNKALLYWGYFASLLALHNIEVLR